ncbi:hypothetical protein TNCV_3282131 [Trichonephila clavipes]|nr:hypothetical protein TNCV_3282131 [Trichonephila clavipes]
MADHVTSSSPVPLKTHHVGQGCTLYPSKTQTSSFWYGVVVRRTGCQLRCGPRHLVPIPLKTRRVGQRCTLNLSRAETSSRWCGVVVRRGGASSGVVHVT